MNKCKIRGKKTEAQKGSVTIFVSLLLVPVLLFTGLMIEFARVKLYESQAVFTVDAYANSILGSFNKELFEMYGLFGYMSDEDREKALEELAVKSFIPDDLGADDPEYEKLVKKLNKLINGEGIDYIAPYSQAKVSYSYDVAKSKNGEKGTLGTDPILKSQISKYTAARLPTYLIESQSDEVNDMLNGIDYVSNLSNYSEIVSIKTQLDAKIEKFYTLLHAYYDDMNALSPNNMANWTSEYYSYYSAYGSEDVYHLIGELYYDGAGEYTDKSGNYPKGVSFTYNIPSYMYIVCDAQSEWKDINEELDSILRRLHNPKECLLGDSWTWNGSRWIANEHIKHEGPCVKVFSDKLVENALLDLEDFREEKKLYDKNKEEKLYNYRTGLSILEANMCLLKNKMTYGNYFTKNFDETLGGLIDQINMPQQFVNIAEKLKTEKDIVKAELDKFDKACDKAIQDGCSEEIIQRMRADYSCLSMFTQPNFDFVGNANKYVDDINDVIFTKLLKSKTVSSLEPGLDSAVKQAWFAIRHYGEYAIVAIGDELEGTMLDDDFNIISEDFEKLLTYADQINEYGENLLSTNGSAAFPVFDIAKDPIYDIEEYNAYEIDSMNLFGHDESYEGFTSALTHNDQLRQTSGTDATKDTTLYDEYYRSTEELYYRQYNEDGTYSEKENYNPNKVVLKQDIRVKEYKIATEQKKWFSIIKDDTPIGSYDGNPVTNATFYENLRNTFVSSKIVDDKSNSYINKAKALLNACNDVEFLSYGNMPTKIDSKVFEELSSNVKIENDKPEGLTDILLMAEEFFSNFDMEDFVKDQTNNIMVMLYDYNMFSCNTTDREYIGDVGENKDDGYKTVGKNTKDAADSDSVVGECTALTVLNEGKSSTELAKTNNIKKQENTAENKNTVQKLYKPCIGRDKSMTNQVYATTSALYYGGDSDKDNIGLGGSELEYIFGGDSEADNNLASVRLTLMLERLVLNYISTYTIEELDTVLREINTVVSAAFSPVAGIVTESLLRLAIACLETNSDMLILLAAGKVTLIKSDLTQLSTYSMLRDVLTLDSNLDNSVNDSDKPNSDKLSNEEALNTEQTKKMLPEKNDTPSTDFVKPEDTNATKAAKTLKFPEINLNYKQYLAINLFLFTNPADRLSRTRDLIDLNVNMKMGNLIMMPESKGASSINISDKPREAIKFKNEDKKPDNFFVTADQITTIEAKCQVSLAPFFSSASVESLSGDKETAEEVQSYLSDERTFSVIRGY